MLHAVDRHQRSPLPRRPAHGGTRHARIRSAGRPDRLPLRFLHLRRYAWRLFELHTQYGPHDTEWIMHRLSEGRPVGLTAFAPDWGNHSVLCVGATHEAAYVVNWKVGSLITEVPWSSIRTAPYAQQEATAFALRGGWDGEVARVVKEHST